MEYSVHEDCGLVESSAWGVCLIRTAKSEKIRFCGAAYTAKSMAALSGQNGLSLPLKS